MKKHLFFIFIISVIFWGTFALIGVGGEYPIGDDWSFNLALKHLIENDEIKLTGWTSMPLVTQLYTADLFMNEFSFSASRFITICMSFLNLILVYLISFKINNNYFLSLFASLLLFVVPEYLFITYSFNTDVQYLFWMFLTLYFTINYYKTNKNRNIIFIFLFFSVSILLRDLTFVIPAGMICYELFKKFTKKEISYKNIIISILLILLFALIIKLYRNFLIENDNLPKLFDLQKGELFATLLNPLKLISQIVKSSFKIMIYLGAYLFVPVLCLNIRNLKIDKLKLFISSFISVLVTSSIFLFQKIKILQFLFFDFVLDSQYLYNDIYFNIFSFILISLSIFSIIFLFLNFRSINIKNEKVLLLFISVCYMGVFSLIFPFAKYLMFLVPMFFLVFASDKNLNYKYISLYITLIFLIISLPQLHDVHEIVSNKKDIIDNLQGKGYNKEEISAGFEFSGLYNYSEDMEMIEGYFWDRNTIVLISTYKNDDYFTKDSVKIELINLFKKEKYLYIQEK